MGAGATSQAYTHEVKLAGLKPRSWRTKGKVCSVQTSSALSLLCCLVSIVSSSSVAFVSARLASFRKRRASSMIRVGRLARMQYCAAASAGVGADDVGRRRVGRERPSESRCISRAGVGLQSRHAPKAPGGEERPHSRHQAVGDASSDGLRKRAAHASVDEHDAGQAFLRFASSRRGSCRPGAARSRRRVGGRRRP